MGEGSPIFIKKIQEIKNRRWEFLKVGERRNRGKTNIETKSFIPKNTCDNEKYIPTTKYVTTAPPQKVQEKHFRGLSF